MKKCIIIHIVFFMAIYLPTIAEDCLYTDSLWQRQKPSTKRHLMGSPSFKTMENECLHHYLILITHEKPEDNQGASLFSSVKKYCQIHGSFSLATLYSLISLLPKERDKQLSNSIISLWKKYNPPFKKIILNYIDRGQFAEADSLYYVCSQMTLLNSNDMLKWTQVKAVINDFQGAARIFCTVSNNERGFQSLARNQFVRMLNESGSSDIQRQALKLYEQCCNLKSKADSLSLLKWISRTYRRFNLFKEEIKAVISLSSDSLFTGRYLIGIAQYHFANRRIRLALNSARLAWSLVITRIDQQHMANLVFKSYYTLGQGDSALIWLNKLDFVAPVDLVKAITLFQEEGFLVKADSLILSYPQSLTRDTLIIRQHLYKNQLASAQKYLSSCISRTDWRNTPADIFLWKLRLALFAKDQSRFNLYLDSLKALALGSSWLYTAEILNYRIARQRLQPYPAAFTFWAQLRYKIFINKAQELLDHYSPRLYQWPLKINEFLIVTFIEVLIKNKHYEPAQYLLKTIPDSIITVSIKYYQALVLFKRGFIKEAQKKFEEIIISNTDDVYAHQARIYLLKIKKSLTM